MNKFPSEKILFSPSQKKTLQQAKNWAEDIYSKAKNEGRAKAGHLFDHTERVTGMTGVLAAMEGSDPFLPVLSALLHDVGRTSADPRSLDFRHGQLSREMSSDFINSLPFTEKDKQLIKNAIEDHPKLNDKVRISFVVKILMDADRMDMIGAVGPVRSAAHRCKLPLYSSILDNSTNEVELKTIYQDFSLRPINAYDMLWTKSAKEFAQPRIKFLKKFILEYKKELSFMHQAFDSLQL